MSMRPPRPLVARWTFTALALLALSASSCGEKKKEEAPAAPPEGEADPAPAGAKGKKGKAGTAAPAADAAATTTKALPVLPDVVSTPLGAVLAASACPVSCLADRFLAAEAASFQVPEGQRFFVGLLFKLDGSLATPTVSFLATRNSATETLAGIGGLTPENARERAELEKMAHGIEAVLTEEVPGVIVSAEIYKQLAGIPRRASSPVALDERGLRIDGPPTVHVRRAGDLVMAGVFDESGKLAGLGVFTDRVLSVPGRDGR